MSKDEDSPGKDAAKPVAPSTVTLVPDPDIAQTGAVEVKAPTPGEESAALKEAAADSTRLSEAAAERLAIAQAELEEMKNALSTAADFKALRKSAPERTPAPEPDDVDTEIDHAPAPLRPSRPDPLSAAEQALAMAAKARGVPLELPSRVPPDRSDPFAAATRALQTARIARGDTPQPTASAPSPSSRHRDPFKAAEAALERAAAARAEVGVSPDQDKREAAARAELARLRAIKPTSTVDSDSDSDTPTRKKRDL